MSLISSISKNSPLSTEKAVIDYQESEIATPKDGQHLSSLVIVIENLRKKIEDGHEPSKISPTYFLDIPLVTGISCYTEYAIGRDIAIRYYLYPLLLPPISISDLIKPLEIFVLKESRENRWFRITITEKDEDTDHLGGRFLRSTGNIELFVSRTIDPLKTLPLFKGPSTELIHEVCHKIIDKLVWDNQPSYPPSTQLKRIFSAAQTDMQHLQETCWQKSHIALNKLREVRRYPFPKQAEEYFVRIPEILFIIANEQPALSLKKIEEILIRDTPCLYKIYKEEFLPALTAYNNNLYTKPAKLPPSKLKKKRPTFTFS
jgi:hypothetical protein